MKTKNYILILMILFITLITNKMFAQLDQNFSGDGKLLISSLYNAEIKQVKMQSTGKLVLVGTIGDSIIVVRLNTNGTLDNSFDTDGILYIDLPSTSEDGYGLAIQSDDKIVIAGRYNDPTDNRTVIIRLNSNGTIDNSFDTDGYITITNGNIVYIPADIKIQSDGKIVVLTNTGLFRLTSTGSLDNSFDTDGKVEFNLAGSTPTHFCMQTDGKFVISGSYNNNSIVLRVNSNGTFDNSFGSSGIQTVDVNSDPNDRADAITLLEDGHILVGGYITNQIYLMRLNSSDGSVDNTYGGGDGFINYSFPGVINNVCYDIQEDTVSNDILVSGSALYGSKGYFAISRVSSTGSLEAFLTINMSDGTSEAKSIFIQPDRQIVFAGYATQANKYTMAVARVDSDFTTLIDGVEDATTVSVGLNLFPNPASYNINIHSSSTIENIRVLDVIGNEVLNTNSNGNTQLDISSLSKGLYNFIITTDKGIGSKKISIQ